MHGAQVAAAPNVRDLHRQTDSQTGQVFEVFEQGQAGAGYLVRVFGRQPRETIGQSHAAPRTPLESPCAARLMAVSTPSENA